MTLDVSTGEQATTGAANFNQVTLPVRDMAAAVAFYRELDCVLIVDTPHYARFECPGGDATFSLSLEEGDYHNGAIIYFEHAELDRWVSELKTRGVQFEEEPTDQPYLWREAVLRDPSGNKIKLFHAGSNRHFPPWRV